MSSSNNELTEATELRLEILFHGEERQIARNMLTTQCGSNLPFHAASSATDLERVRFAALKLSKGDLHELDVAIRIAQTDWRDVLVAAGFATDLRAHEVWIPRTPIKRVPGIPLSDNDHNESASQ